jgi:hypothetical protein
MLDMVKAKKTKSWVAVAAASSLNKQVLQLAKQIDPSYKPISVVRKAD